MTSSPEDAAGVLPNIPANSPFVVKLNQASVLKASFPFAKFPPFNLCTRFEGSPLEGISEKTFMKFRPAAKP